MKHFTLPKDGGLIEKDLPADILHSYEKIPAEIYGDQEDASREIAGTIISAIKSHTGGRFRLGLTTGTTPVSLYRELSAKYKEGAISFANVEIFSIDEYYPVGKAEAQSRNHRLHEEFLNNVDVPKENIHIPDGTVPKDRITAYCAEYDKAIPEDCHHRGHRHHHEREKNHPHGLGRGQGTGSQGHSGRPCNCGLPCLLPPEA